MHRYPLSSHPRRLLFLILTFVYNGETLSFVHWPNHSLTHLYSFIHSFTYILLGQSNMALNFHPIYDNVSLIAGAHTPEIRLFKVPITAATDPLPVPNCPLSHARKNDSTLSLSSVHSQTYVSSRWYITALLFSRLAPGLQQIGPAPRQILWRCSLPFVTSAPDRCQPACGVTMALVTLD